MTYPLHMAHFAVPSRVFFVAHLFALVQSAPEAPTSGAKTAKLPETLPLPLIRRQSRAELSKGGSFRGFSEASEAVTEATPKKKTCHPSLHDHWHVVFTQECFFMHVVGLGCILNFRGNFKVGVVP